MCNVFSFTHQELTLRMERMTDDASKKKRELEHELTLTMTAQVSYMKLIFMSDLLCVTNYPPTRVGMVRDTWVDRL